jgi:hypothetical protein
LMQTVYAFEHFIYLFHWSGVWTQGFTLGEQALYSLNYISSPFWTTVLPILPPK